MLHGYQNHGKIFNLRFNYMPFCICHFRATICQKYAQLIAWNDKHTNVNMSLHDGLPQVNEVNDKQITPGRELNLNTNADLCSIYDLAFGPIHITCLFFCPSLCFLELGIDQLPHRRTTVRIPRLFNQKRKAGYDQTNFT